MHQNFHNFYWDHEHRSKYANVNHHFESTTLGRYTIVKFYSYSTPIAYRIIDSVLYKEMYLVTTARYSNTTTKHQSDLISACPNRDNLFILKRMRFESYTFSKCIIDFCDSVKRLLKNEDEKEILRKKENREEIIDLYNDLTCIVSGMANRNSEELYGDVFTNHLQPTISLLRDIYCKCRDKEQELCQKCIKRRMHIPTPEEIKKKEEEKEKKELRMRKRLESLDKMDLLKDYFTRGSKIFSEEVKKAFGKTLKYDESYVYIYTKTMK